MTIEEAMMAQTKGQLVSNGNEVMKIKAVALEKGSMLIQVLDTTMMIETKPDKFYRCDATGRKLNDVII